MFKTLNGWHIIYDIFGIKIKKKITPKHYDTLNLVFDEKEGIGNRIFGLINCINYTTPQKVNMYWSNKGWVSAKFSEIFDYNPNFELKEYHHSSIIKRWIHRGKWYKEATVFFPPITFKTTDGVELDYATVSEELFNQYSKEFHKLKPSAKVIDRIKSVNLPEKFVALQVRNSKDWEKYGRNESLTSFFDAMDEFDKDTKFYLSSMDKETSEAFRERFGERIIELPDKNSASMIDAMADLYILSYSDNAIYSYGSTFGILAFWLSENMQKIKVIGSSRNWKEQKGFNLKNE